MVKVKICGNRTAKDLTAARDADAVGFIVATPESTRNISTDRAARLTEEAPPLVSKVMVTTEKQVTRLEELVRYVEPDYLQLHSNLSSNQIEEISVSLPDRVGLIALLSVTSDDKGILDRARKLAKSPAAAILLDSKAGGKTGGTGKIHDWEASRKVRDFLHPFPLFLAGGLRPENVQKAINKVRPYAVDVATGVEEDGMKSIEKVKSLLSEVKSVEI